MENAHVNCTKVFLVEDSPVIRMRLIDMLSHIEGIVIVGGAESPASAIEGIRRTRPDSVVLDIHLLGGSGIDVLREMHPAHPGVVFIVLTNHVHSQYRRLYMEAGASYFLDKTNEFGKVKAILAGLGAQR